MEAALENVLRFLRGEKPHNLVDPSDYVKADSKGRSR